jgi:hypothetical protein
LFSPKTFGPPGVVCCCFRWDHTDERDAVFGFEKCSEKAKKVVQTSCQSFPTNPGFCVSMSTDKLPTAKMSKKIPERSHSWQPPPPSVRCSPQGLGDYQVWTGFFIRGGGVSDPLVPPLLLGPPLFPFLGEGSTTLLTGMTSISLHSHGRG